MPQFIDTCWLLSLFMTLNIAIYGKHLHSSKRIQDEKLIKKKREKVRKNIYSQEMKVHKITLDVQRTHN